MNKIMIFYENLTKICFLISVVLFYIKIKTENEIFIYLGLIFLVIALVIILIIYLSYGRKK